MKGLEVKEFSRCEENFDLVENRVTYHIFVEGVKVGETVVIEPLTEDQAEEQSCLPASLSSRPVQGHPKLFGPDVDHEGSALHSQ